MSESLSTTLVLNLLIVLVMISLPFILLLVLGRHKSNKHRGSQPRTTLVNPKRENGMNYIYSGISALIIGMLIQFLSTDLFGILAGVFYPLSIILIILGIVKHSSSPK